MTKLRSRLIERISANGPMDVGEFMSTCLTDPELGYYTTRDPFGTSGDFVTAPEVSQMFGELVGLALAQCWLDQGAPKPFILCELGPGRGTLMADVLRAAARVPGFVDAAQVHLVEASPRLRQTQAQSLAAYAPAWHSRFSEVPSGPLLLIANEFFDALPIRQFVRAEDGWQERLAAAENEELVWSLGPEKHPSALDDRYADTKVGDVVETGTAGEAIVRDISTRIAECGGCALIIDYGDWRSLGDTLQALNQGQMVEPLAEPGASDLTAHVDFEGIAKAATTGGSAHTRLTPQGTWLTRLGLTQRAQALAARASDKDREDIISAYGRLTNATEMGTLFKVLAIHPTDAPLPPGFVP